MGIGVSAFLIAVGAILTFAITKTVNGIDLQTVGVILMAVGALGLATFVAVFGRNRHTTVVQQHDVVPPAQVYTRDVY